MAPPPQLSQTVVYQPPPVVPAPAAVAASAACAVLRWGGGACDLTTDVTLIGRNKRCDVVLPDPNVSRRHAEIRREGDDYVIIDLDSTNGVHDQRQGGEARQAGRWGQADARHERSALREATLLDVVLLALKAGFLILLFLFIWLVMRGAARDVVSWGRASAPLGGTLPEPAPPSRAAPVVSPAPPPVTQPAAERVVARERRPRRPGSSPARRRRRSPESAAVARRPVAAAGVRGGGLRRGR